MHYVKQFNINDVDTMQVACIELQGKPNAATVGAIGLLGIDMLSPTHEVYKCVAVNGAIYTWELLSSGLSTISSTISGNGEEQVQFPYNTLNIPTGYLIKVGDLIIDSKGYEYQVSAIDVNSCSATYCGSAFLKGDKGDPGLTPHVGENGHWWVGNTDTGVMVSQNFVSGTVSSVMTGSGGSVTHSISIALDFTPKLIIIIHRTKDNTLTWMAGRYVCMGEGSSGAVITSGDSAFKAGVVTIEESSIYMSSGEYSYIAMG